ncbi:hypothetical protein ACTI_15270 [Actinoplanes sp. OR16]|uniref:site-specific integrase n=1 Tax=Actinoplanes sp. OR16 TaxID=946334 RepID=UPI000F6DFE86|nr:site-specific integrase [Actinoplanes sp. OR16]BBH64842.1 hypothetical protein ACTI_15270 [Actinoplanes sp. OR16]
MKDVDVFARTITVNMQLQELPMTAEMVWVTPKSRMSRRTVTMPACTVNAVIPLVSGRDRDEVVFTAVQGGYVRYRVFWKTWSKITAAAGLAGLRIHDLRHTQVGWLISANNSLTGIQRRLGHASISVTSDRYGHLLPVVDENIVATLDAALPAVPARGVGETGQEQLRSTGKIKDGRAAQVA